MQDVSLGTSGSGNEPATGRILVVSADVTRCQIICCALLGAGHTVSVAADDAAALQRLHGSAFDLLLIDGARSCGTFERIQAALGEPRDGIAPPAILSIDCACQGGTSGSACAEDDGLHADSVEIAALLAGVDGRLGRRRACSASRNSEIGRGRSVSKTIQRAHPGPANSKNAENEGVLVGALDAIEDGFVLWDAEDRLVVCNDAYRNLFGCDADRVIPGTPFEDLMRLQLESGRLRVPPKRLSNWLAQRIMQHRDPNGAIEDEFSDGTWVRVTESRTREGFIVGVCSEISQAKRREIALKTFAEGNRRLAAAVDATSCAILITDPDRPGNPTVFANPGFSAMTGWPVEEALGRDRSFLNGPETDLDEVARLEQDMRAGRATSALLRLKVRNGRTFWANVSANPIRDGDGRITNWVIVQTAVGARTETADPDRRLRRRERSEQLAAQHAQELDSLLTSLRGNL